MKSFRIDPIGSDVDVRTSTPLVRALLDRAKGLKQVCGGKGMCATCHVFVTEGMGSLSPIEPRERRTLGMISGANERSRLACQARVLGEGVKVEVPPGIYLERLADAEALIGRRADAPLVHPVDGRVLVPSGKIITRTVVTSIKNLDVDVISLLSRSEQAFS